MFVGFTTFSTTVMTSVTKEAFTDHLCIVLPDPLMQHFPKIWVLNLTADKVLKQQTIAVLPNQSDATPSTEAGTPSKVSSKESNVKEN